MVSISFSGGVRKRKRIIDVAVVSFFVSTVNNGEKIAKG